MVVKFVDCLLVKVDSAVDVGEAFKGGVDCSSELVCADVFGNFFISNNNFKNKCA